MMRACILLECPDCGSRFAWPEFGHKGLEQNSARNQLWFAELICSLPQGCPVCFPIPPDVLHQSADLAGDAVEGIEAQQQRARGDRWLDGRLRVPQ